MPPGGPAGRGPPVEPATSGTAVRHPASRSRRGPGVAALLHRRCRPHPARPRDLVVPGLSALTLRGARARQGPRSSVRGGRRNPAPTTGCRVRRDRAWPPRPAPALRPAPRRRRPASRCAPRSGRCRGGAATGPGRARAARDRRPATACRRRRSTDRRGFAARARTHRAKRCPAAQACRERTLTSDVQVLRWPRADEPGRGVGVARPAHLRLAGGRRAGLDRAARRPARPAGRLLEQAVAGAGPGRAAGVAARRARRVPPRARPGRDHTDGCRRGDRGPAGGVPLHGHPREGDG